MRDVQIPPVKIGPINKLLSPLALGSFIFGAQSRYPGVHPPNFR